MPLTPEGGGEETNLPRKKTSLFVDFIPKKKKNHTFSSIYHKLANWSYVALKIKERMTRSRNWRWVCASPGVYSYQEYLSYYVLWTVSTTFVPQSCSTTREETPVIQQIFHTTHKVRSKTYQKFKKLFSVSRKLSCKSVTWQADDINITWTANDRWLEGPLWEQRGLCKVETREADYSSCSNRRL